MKNKKLKNQTSATDTSTTETTNNNRTTLSQAYEDMIANANASKQQQEQALAKQNTSSLSQLYNAKQNAMKYADVTAQAQGYSTQGAAVQSTGSLNNAYLNQVQNQNANYEQTLANANANYNSEINQLNAQKAQADEQETTNLVNNYINAISTSTDKDQVQKYYDEALKQGFTGSNKQALEMAYEAQAKNLGMNNGEIESWNKYNENNPATADDVVTSLSKKYNINVNDSTATKTSVNDILNSNNSGKLRKVLGDTGTGNQYALQALKYLFNNLEVNDGDSMQLGTDVYVYYKGSLYKVSEKADSKVKSDVKFKISNSLKSATLKDKLNGSIYTF